MRTAVKTQVSYSFKVWMSFLHGQNSSNKSKGFNGEFVALDEIQGNGYYDSLGAPFYHTS